MSDTAPIGFGIFKWTAENRYPKENAIKVYKRETAADAFVNKPEHANKNWVVRKIWS
jgi:hypothetical protein